MGGGKCEGGAESRIILVIEWMEDIGGQLGWGVLLFASIFVCTTNIPSRSLSHSPLISLFFHILRGGLILIIVFEYCCLLLLSKRGGFIKASGQPFTMRILTNRCSFNPKLSLSYHNVWANEQKELTLWLGCSRVSAVSCLVFARSPHTRPYLTRRIPFMLAHLVLCFLQRLARQNCFLFLRPLRICCQ